MLEPVQNISEESDREVAGSPRVTLMGVGKGGISIVSEIHLPDIPLQRVIADTSRSDLEAAQIPDCRKIRLGEKSLRGFSAGLQATVGEKAAKESEKQIIEALAGTDLLLLVAALGHGTGSGASPVIAEIAQSLNIPVVCFATNPFSDEGKIFTEQATAAAEKLSELCNAFVLVDNEIVAQITAGNQVFDDVFNTGRNWIERGVLICCSMIFSAQTGMSLDFSSFKNIFPVAGTRTLFGIGSGQGENAVDAALNELFQCPLLHSGHSATHADTIAIRVCAGTPPSIQQMEEISKRVQKQFGGEDRTLSNFAVCPELGDTVEISIIGADDVRITRRRLERTATPSGGKFGSPSVIPSIISAPDDAEGEELLFPPEKKRLYCGVDLDAPTYRRKRIKLQDELDAWRKRLKNEPKN